MAGRTRTLPSLPCRTLWLAAGFLLVGMMWPELLTCVGRVLSAGGDGSPQQGASIEGEGDSTPWELVDEGGGFRTFVSKVSSTGALSLRGETVVDEHIGRLYTAFLNTTSTLDWVRFLVEVEELPAVAARGGWGGGVGKLSAAAVAAGGGGGAGKHLSSGAGDGAVLFQKYDMPWPVKDREVVLRRSISLDKRAKKMIATYHSTDHPARPITGDTVRAIVHRTSWVFTSVGRAKTSIEFETSTDPKGALPTTMVGFMQKKFPRDTVAGFVGSAKGVAIHSTMAKW